MKYPATALGVFVAHLCLLAVLATYTASTPPTPPPPPPASERGSSDVKGAADNVVQVTPLASEGIHNTGDECTSKKYYAGLGLRYLPGLGYVTMVGHNTPASAAGIQIGDVLTDGPDPDTQPVGSRVVLHILRGSVKVTVHLTVAKICQE